MGFQVEKNLAISINRYLNVNAGICFQDILLSQAFWLLFVVQLLLTNHVWVSFSCMQVNSLCGEQKMAEMQRQSPSACLLNSILFISCNDSCRYLFIDQSSFNKKCCTLHDKRSIVSVLCYPDIRWLHLKPQNTGCCPPGLNHHQMMADGF